MKKILISGNFFSWNYGTMAMALSLIDQLSGNDYCFYKASVDLDNDIRNFSKEVDLNRLTIFGFNKGVLPMFIASPLLLFFLLKWIRKADIVLETPGEIPGDLSFCSQLSRFLVAKLFRKKFVIYGCSLGPFKCPITIKLSRWFYTKVDALLVREKSTQNYFEKIGINNSLLTSDHTFLLKSKKNSRLEELKKKISPFIGISVKHKYFYKYPSYKRDVKELINYISNKLKVEVLLIPHGKEDELPSKIIFEDNKKEKIFLLKGDFSPPELKWLISRSVFFIGSRVHACIAALSSEVPTIVYIPFSDHRSKGFMSEFALKDVVVDPNISGDLLIKFKKYYLKRNILRKKISDKLPVLKKRAGLNAIIVNDLLKKTIND